VLKDFREGTSEMQAVSGRDIIIRALGHLWLAGAEINWQTLYSNERRHRVHLPTYSFERQRYWTS